MKFTKAEKSWIAYDWANSAYATIMIAAIFPIYFAGICGDTTKGSDFYWSLGMTFATAISAISVPILGAIGDYKGMKKKLFSAYLVMGLFFTALCAFVDVWQFTLLGFSLSYIGYSCSCMLYDSFLPDVTTNERMDKVSSWGYSMGYIGGSTIPFVMSILILTFGAAFGIDSVLAVKLAVIICVLWWAVFSIPMLKNCHQQYGSEVPSSKLISSTFSSIGRTLKDISKNRGILLFILAYFFYIDGVNTVINMATAYGSALGLDSNGMILALLVTQIVAFPCAILFGKLAGKFGTINMLLGSIALYFIICLVGFVMGFGIEEGFLTVSQALVLFWILSVMVGLVQGGIQALSRSHFGKIIPKEKSSEYFGIFDIFGKFAAVMGPFIYAFVKGATGRSSFAILAIILLFFIGGGFMLACKRAVMKGSEK